MWQAQLTFVNVAWTGWMLNSNLSLCCSVKPSWNSVHQSSSGSSASSFLHSWAPYVSFSLTLSPSARLVSTWAAWSKTTPFLAFGMSNCFIITFAVMLRMYRKHHIDLRCQGSRPGACWGGWSLCYCGYVVSSHTQNLFKEESIHLLCLGSIFWPCHLCWTFSEPWQMRVWDWHLYVILAPQQYPGALWQPSQASQSGLQWRHMPCDLVRSKYLLKSWVCCHIPVNPGECVISHSLDLTDLQHLHYLPMHAHKDGFHIAWQGLHQWNMILRSPTLHECYNWTPISFFYFTILLRNDVWTLTIWIWLMIVSSN